jgi:hypothetical protein
MAREHGEPEVNTPILYWDLGNSWCDIIKVTPKKGHEEWLQWFFDRVWETTDEETMGESDDDDY